MMCLLSFFLSFFFVPLCVGFVEAHRWDIVNTLRMLVGRVLKMLPAKSRYWQLCDKLGLSDKVTEMDEHCCAG